MRLRKLLEEFPVSAAMAIIAAANVGGMLIYRTKSALIFAGCYALLLLAALLRVKYVRFKRERLLATLAQRMDIMQSEILTSYPVPVLVCDEHEAIVHFNEKFIDQVAQGELVSDSAPERFTGGQRLCEMAVNEPLEVQVQQRYFTLYCARFHYKEKLYYALYYTDNSAFHAMQRELEESRSYVLLLDIDDISQMGLGFRDSEYAEIHNGIEALIELWAQPYACLLRRISDERYILLAQERDVRKMLENKFDILNDVRKYAYRERELGITLAIGVGTGDTPEECENAAHRALEMAIGRGGDQAALKTENSYEFYGGISKSVEKRTKAKTRAVASTLTDLISTCESVVIMGHTFPDLDAMGAAIGLLAITRSLNVPAYIVANPAHSLAQALLERARQEYKRTVIIDEERAKLLLANNCLLLLVDTHIASFLDFPDLFPLAKHVAVIDHHRKMVNHIDNAVIFHHDPNASSSCEMVTELIQYITPDVNRFEAEALLAGIMLDTKNFILRTRVRTFDAAAFLKGKGADTVKVKRLFASSMEDNKQRYALVTNAQMYRDCAVSVTQSRMRDIRVVSSQAADELLNVEGVRASFVIFPDAKGNVCITARSYGDLNVQLIMERMGGGGHRTMAAAQFTHTDTEQVLAELKQSIDEQAEERIGNGT